eukprot:gene12002-12146_t
MLQARASTDAIFKDWGVEDESLDRLKSSVLALVLVLTPVVVAVAILNCWLELSNKPCPGSSAADMGLFLSGLTSTCQRITVANWTWLLADLQDQLSKVVRQLTVAVVGAVFLWLSSSWMFGYVTSQGTHVQRDLMLLLHPQGSGIDSSLSSARAATMLGGA